MNRPAKLAAFTFVEVLVCISIIAILAMFAAPLFNNSFARNKLYAVAEALSADLHWARSEALKRNVPVKVTFTPNASGTWQYEIATNPSAPLTSDILKTVNSSQVSEFSELKMPANFRSNGNNVLIFDEIRGTLNGLGGTATFFTLDNAFTLSVKVSILGRVEICSIPNKLGRYLKC